MIQKIALGILKTCIIFVIYSASEAKACESAQVVENLANLRNEMLADYETMSAIYDTQEGQARINYYSAKVAELANILGNPGDCSTQDLKPIEFDAKHISIYLTKISRGEFNLHN